MIITTQDIAGKQITHYSGLVTGEAVTGANMFRDMFTRVRDIVGGPTPVKRN